ncbi:cytochrome P450 [Streptomyces spectabilis]|uniref:Cytochrome P450 n=1 Tax=Streptomyces spectabilis TaxID=68270 RepID=A0A7W8B760_STRST|nr:cytochrome P450 [Streptomyces spectabilis]MBB5109808.1 cytochrome P450 [Streptomyces spectabilis]GGV57035.1 cytochrome P-450 like protein [Streptomyces spectabilis]
MKHRDVAEASVGDLVRALATQEVRRDPYPTYRRLREHPPVYDERHRAYLATRYSDCLEALTGKDFGRPDKLWLDRRIPNWREFRGLVAISRLMQFGDPQAHARLRGTVTRFFTARRIKSLLAYESQSVDTLLDTLSDALHDQGVVDIQEALSFQLPSISIAGLLGIPAADVRHFRRYTLAIGRALEPALSAQQLAELDSAYQTITTYFDGVVANRRQQPREDMATYLVRCCDNDGIIAPDELTPMFLSVYGAGTVNTSNFIGNGIAALLDTPAEATMLRADPGLADAAVTEILRYDAPMQVTRRIALTDTELGGCRIPAGAEIAVLLGAANHDTKVFKEPDVFRIQRDGSKPLSFGAGTFFCIGAALGKLEGALVFRKLISRFPSLQLADGAIHNRRSVLRGYINLPVTLAPRT